MSVESTSESSASITETPEAKRRAWKRYGFAMVPAIAFLELVGHLAQATSKVPDRDWIAARAAVQSIVQPSDLVVFAPGWVDPVGRSFFKDDIATVSREARPDDTGFARAIEVSIRDAHLPEFDGWPVKEKKRIGAIALTTYENPSFKPILDDLVADFEPPRAAISRVNGANEVACPFQHSHAQTGGIGFGAAIPSARFACPQGGFVGVSIAQTLDYRPHQCIYMQPQGGGSVTRIRFADVTFGHELHGHHAISWAQERFRTGVPVTLVFKVGDRLLGRLVHNDGDSWKEFTLDTADLAGTKGELVAEISAQNERERFYCFEANTR